MTSQAAGTGIHVFDTELMAIAMLNAAIWSADHDEAEPTEGAFRVAKMCCEQFVQQAGADLQAVLDYPEYWSHPDCYGRPEIAIGHDLWLDASGSGVGFWDRDALPDDLRDKLSKHADNFAAMTHGAYANEDGTLFYLDVQVPGLEVLVTPVGFDDAHFDSHAQREAVLQAAYQGLVGELKELGLQAPAPSVIDNALGYVGSQAFHLHRSTDGIRGVISYSDESIKNFAYMPEHDLQVFHQQQEAAKLLLAKAAENLGCELRLLKYGEPTNVVSAPADFEGVDPQGRIVLKEQKAANTLVGKASQVVEQRQRDATLDGPSM